MSDDFKKVVSDASTKADIADTADKVDKFRQYRIAQKAKQLMSWGDEKGAKKLLSEAISKLKASKKLPVIGGLIAAASTGDVSAAVPVLSEADDLGPEQGSPEYLLETGDVEGFQAAMKERKKQELIQRVINKMGEK